jgi:hypothetical protein
MSRGEIMEMAFGYAYAAAYFGGLYWLGIG